MKNMAAHVHQQLPLAKLVLMWSLAACCLAATAPTPVPAAAVKRLTSSEAPDTIVPARATTPLPLAAATPSTAPYPTKKVALSTLSEINLRVSTEKPARGGAPGPPEAPAPPAAARAPARLAALDCELPGLARGARLWRGNETHELHLPITECGGGGGGGDGGGGGAEACAPAQAWVGAADMQSGDMLLVRIADAMLAAHATADNATEGSASAGAQPAVYQVNRRGHEHCDVTDGSLLDVAPLDDAGDKVFSLLDRDLSEGDNLLIVVSAAWGARCVRLDVTVKTDNCGDAQDCSGRGVCFTNASMDGYECQCCPGFEGPHCEERDPCAPGPCLNDGICVALAPPHSPSAPAYHCLCPYGFTGRRCEKDPCAPAPCLNGGSCMSQAAGGSTAFRCACAPGWAGARCHRPLPPGGAGGAGAVGGGACSARPCVHGICVDQDGEDAEGLAYRCFCQPGYTGSRCELEYNECESSPCAHGGTCTDRVGGFSCACGRGYSGDLCQDKVDLCAPNPCGGRRFCIDRGNSAACECPRGLVGDDCALPAAAACDNNPCAHGGTCWSGADSFYCSCRPGYTGRMCEEIFILETVVSADEGAAGAGAGAGAAGAGAGAGGVRERPSPLGLYHDRRHNVYIAVGTLGAALAIVAVVVTTCHCRVNKTYSRILSRLSRAAAAGPPHHWLQDKAAPPAPPAAPSPPAPLDADMYYTLDFSDSQSSPLIQ